MPTVVNLTKKAILGVPWRKIKNAILGNEYNLSLIIAGERRMKTLNKRYRKQDYAADTLSFSYSKNQGEVFLNAENSGKKALFLFIHSLLHLKGLEHGEKMESLEQMYYNKFNGT